MLLTVVFLFKKVYTNEITAKIQYKKWIKVISIMLG